MKKNKIIIGKFAAPYGVRGWIKLQSFTDPADSLEGHSTWCVNHQGQWHSLTIEDIKPHGNFFIAKIAGIDDRDEVQMYTNDLIGLEREALPDLPKNEYYWEDLIGLMVVNLEGSKLGRVTQLLATGANDVLQVETDKKRRLIPYTEHTVKKVDLKGGTITVDWDADF